MFILTPLVHTYSNFKNAWLDSCPWKGQNVSFDGQ